MTEADWLTSTNLKSLTDYLVRQNYSPRKLRLYVVACCRHVEHLLRHPDSLKALDAAERVADGLLHAHTLTRWYKKAFEARQGMKGAEGLAAEAVLLSCQGARDRAYLLGPHAAIAALATETGMPADSPEWRAARDARRPLLFNILRDIVPNPFSSLPTADPAWLEADGGLAARLAQSIYEERRFAEVPILADALEDAGCTEAAILDHLRGPGPHARGCWALDVLLGKE